MCSIWGDLVASSGYVHKLLLAVGPSVFIAQEVFARTLLAAEVSSSPEQADQVIKTGKNTE